MKKISLTEFAEILSKDPALSERVRACPETEAPRLLEQIAGELGYELDRPAMEALPDDDLSEVAGGRNPFADPNGGELNPGRPDGTDSTYFWLQYGGVPVGPWLAAHADRLHCAHLKDLAPHGFEARMAPVGAGNLDFPGIMRTLNGNGVTEYALIEQDDCYGASPFACLKRSLAYLRALAREM